MDEEYVEISEKYAEMAQDVVEEHKDLRWIASAGIRVCFLSSTKEKKSRGRAVLGECIRVKELYRPFVPYDFLIVIYAPNADALSECQKKILLYHELLHIGIDDAGESLKCVVNPHDIEEFRKVADQYGIDWAVM